MGDCRLLRLTERVDWFTPDDRTGRPSLGAIRGPGGTLLVETGASPAHLSTFLEQLESRGAAPPVVAVLTHWHWDHSFGSQILDVPGQRTSTPLESWRCRRRTASRTP